jgi:cytochrome c-type biogenesis protein
MEHAVTTGSITLFGAFLAGLLSFLSPCVLPLTPAYVARLVGPAVWEGSQLERSAHARLRTVTLLHSTAFVAGFTAMFLALGATASALGSLIAGQQELLRHVGGLVLIVFGLYVAGLLRLPWLDREWRFTRRQGSGGYLASFVVGLIFALGWTPCIGPILAGILLLAAQARTLGSGVLLLFVYSLGLGIPFLVLGLAFDRVAPLLKRLTPYLRVIEVVAGGLLVLMGIVIFFNWLLFINTRLALPGLA